PITLTGRTMWLTNGGLIEHHEGQYTVIWPDNTAVQIHIRRAWLDLLLALPKERRGKVAGLLGNFDGDPKNDLAARDRTGVTLEGLAQDEAYRQLYKVFGDSWRITQTVSLFDYGPGEDTTTYTDLTFPQKLISIADLDEATRNAAEAKCRQAGVSGQPYLDNCILDIGLTGEVAFAKSAVEAASVDIQAVQTVIDAEVRGTSQEDFTLLRQLYAPDAVIIYRGGTRDTSDDRTWKGWDAIQQRYLLEIFPYLRRRPYTLIELSITVNGEQATATHQGTLVEGR